MKNKIIATLLLLFVLSLIFSCEKEEAPLNINSNQGSVLKAPSKYKLLQTVWGWAWRDGFIRYVLLDCYCNLSGGNCLPMIVINGNQTQTLYNNFYTAYETGDMTDYFNGTSYQTLFPDIDSIENVIEGLQDGDITIKHFYNPDDSLDYFIGLPDTVKFCVYDTTWVGLEKLILRVDNN